MNNNIENLINEITKNYDLTAEERNILVNKYQYDTRNINIITQEMKNIADYYKYQNKLANQISLTEPLPPGKNYYVTAFGTDNHVYLQPVSVSVTNPDTSEVLVENTFKGYQKHTNVDDIEIALCQIGKLMEFDIVEEYRVYNQNKQKDSIIIKDLVNDNEFYDVENLKKRFMKLMNAGKLKKETWIEECQQLTIANTKEDYKKIIDYGLNLLKSLPSILEEDYNKIEEKYFDMLIYDLIINQSERDLKDYGILCDKETKRYSFAPLFDNVYPSIQKNNDVLSMNGITCNRYELTECLFYNYYEKIEKRITKILSNKEILIKNIDVILKYNLDYNNYNQILNNIIININSFERLINEKTIESKSQNAGYVNLAQLIIGLGIIIAFSVCIAYLLYCIK